MRFRLGGWAVAAVLVLTGCGVDGGSHGASDASADPPAELASPELVSARDTLPPAPPSTTALTVLLTHTGDASDPGLDAAAGALAERPDIRVLIAVGGTADHTMGGFPVITVPGLAGGIDSAVDAVGVVPDLVVVGITRTSERGGAEPLADAAAAAAIPALVVDVEDGDVPDHAAAARELLAVLDLELDALLDEPAAVHRLTVPSCRAGSLRGRLDVRPTPPSTGQLTSDCTRTDRTLPDDEVAAVTAGYSSLARLP
ncbi:MAG TPA: hypothetical protein VGE43_03585 [Acidimicrobiales bacterium]